MSSLSDRRSLSDQRSSLRRSLLEDGFTQGEYVLDRRLKFKIFNRLEISSEKDVMDELSVKDSDTELDVNSTLYKQIVGQYNQDPRSRELYFTRYLVVRGYVEIIKKWGRLELDDYTIINAHPKVMQWIKKSIKPFVAQSIYERFAIRGNFEDFKWAQGFKFHDSHQISALIAKHGDMRCLKYVKDPFGLLSLFHAINRGRMDMIIYIYERIGCPKNIEVLERFLDKVDKNIVNWLVANNVFNII